MTSILKILFASTTLATCWYGVSIFGLSMWPILFSALSVFILVSLLLPKLNAIAVVISKVMGVLSLIALALLLLASTIGGTSHMSESNQIIAVALAFMAFLGCTFFLLKNPIR